MQEYQKLLHQLTEAIDKEQDLLNATSPNQMYEPMAYILSLGGKRVRPLLTLVGCDLFDVTTNNAIHSALAVELFHNFSLIHDDILDKAPLRRGNTTVHEKWNTNIAILSGDGMMVKAFDELCKSNPAHIHDLLKLFSKTALEVCEGQQFDMNFETQNKVSVDEYIHMITFKTAVLLGCSLQMGSICANTSILNQNHIYEFGKNVGIAFQILDDVLDVYATDDKFGKQIGGDIISNKKTFLVLKALEIAPETMRNDLLALFSDSDLSNSKKVANVTSIFNALDIKNNAINEANKYTDIALTHLSKITATESKKNTLKEFAFHLLNREI